MRIALIVAVADNGVIGRGGDLPWRLPDDMKQFRRRTVGHAVIMGRKTWDSLPKGPLKKRHNIVVTRNPSLLAEGATVVGSLAAAYRAAEEGGAEQAFVIGGASLYAAALERADEVVVTHVRAEVEGDVTLQGFDLADWTPVERSEHPADERHAYPFTVVVYRRRLPASSTGVV